MKFLFFFIGLILPHPIQYLKDLSNFLCFLELIRIIENCKKFIWLLYIFLQVNPCLILECIKGKIFNKFKYLLGIFLDPILPQSNDFKKLINFIKYSFHFGFLGLLLKYLVFLFNNIHNLLYILRYNIYIYIT